MAIQLKAVLDVDVSNSVTVFVDGNGATSAPAITSKVGLVNALMGPIGRILSGASVYGMSAGDFTFTIPVELHMLCRYTVFCDDDSRSVLDVVALSLGIESTRILAEYPTPDRARQVIEFAERALRDAKGVARFLEDELAKSRMELAEVRQRNEDLAAENDRLRNHLDDEA